MVATMIGVKQRFYNNQAWPANDPAKAGKSNSLAACCGCSGEVIKEDDDLPLENSIDDDSVLVDDDSASPGDDTASPGDDTTPADDDTVPTCKEYMQRSSYSGPVETRNVGICQDQIETCHQEQWFVTQEEVLPQTEGCNNLDDNCNNEVDENVYSVNYSGPPETEWIGLCRPEIKVCENGAFVIEQAEALPQEEIPCNGIDENCDGADDPCPTTTTTTTSTSTTSSSTSTSTTTSTRPTTTTSTSTTTVPTTTTSTTTTTAECQTGDILFSYSGPAGTRNVGICRDEVETCQSGQWIVTQQEVLPQEEIACNGIDEDCDGATTQHDAWCPGISSNQNHWGPASGVINGNWYVFDGGDPINNVLEVFDPIADLWQTMTPSPTLQESPKAGVIDDKMYVVGNSLFQMYDPAVDQWSNDAAHGGILAVPPNYGASPAVGVFDGKIFFAGGGLNAETSTLKVYDPISNTWAQKASMPTPRSSSAGGVINGKFYVVGGLFNGICCSDYVTTLEEYDPATDTWETKAPLSDQSYNLEAVVMDDKLWVAGGFNWNTLHQHFLRVYDPMTDSWIDKAPMIQGREGPGIGLINGQIYVVGGNGTDRRSVEYYTP